MRVAADWNAARAVRRIWRARVCSGHSAGCDHCGAAELERSAAESAAAVAVIRAELGLVAARAPAGAGARRTPLVIDGSGPARRGTRALPGLAEIAGRAAATDPQALGAVSAARSAIKSVGAAELQGVHALASGAAQEAARTLAGGNAGRAGPHDAADARAPRA